MVLTSGDTTLTFPWPLWEMLVLRASYEYVSWALANRADYLESESAMAAIGGADLALARHQVPQG